MRRGAFILLALLFGCPGLLAAGSAQLTEGPIERIRGIYLQRAIELATVGTRTVRLTRMTRFRRCGRFRGQAEDFNKHLVEVAGREVEGVGFVAGYVNAIEGCPATAFWHDWHDGVGGDTIAAGEP
ncbi:MAG TPA: hypothetical protein VJT33_00355 [bacterium]|nr:hypothetical protein [bacterium]